MQQDKFPAYKFSPRCDLEWRKEAGWVVAKYKRGTYYLYPSPTHSIDTNELLGYDIGVYLITGRQGIIMTVGKMIPPPLTPRKWKKEIEASGFGNVDE